MTALKLMSIGNSVGVILPKELLVKFGLQKGHTLYAVETEDGFRLTVSDAEFEAQMAARAACGMTGCLKALWLGR